MQIAATTLGGVDPGIDAFAETHPQYVRVRTVAATVPAPPETEFDRMRREAAEPQARLAAAETVASGAVASTTPRPQ